MGDMTDLATATNAVADPTTAAADLAVIVQAHPSLRAAVAAHPNTYPALLDWLDNLGDPTISAAVTARRAREESPVPGPLASSPVTMAPDQPSAPVQSQFSMAPQQPQAQPSNQPQYPMAPQAQAPMVTPQTAPSYTGVRADFAGAPQWAPSQSPYGPSQSSASNTSMMTIIAAVLFFAGAALALITLIVEEFDGCDEFNTATRYTPLGWSSSTNYWCYTSHSSGVSNTIVLLGFAVLAVCGILILTMGKKDAMKTDVLIGWVLCGMTALAIIVDIVGLFQYTNGYGYPGLTVRLLITDLIYYLVYLCVPLFFVLMVRSKSAKSLRQWRIGLMIAMGVAIIGVRLIFSIFYHSMSIPSFITMNLGNILLVVALILLAFALKVPASQTPSQFPPYAPTLGQPYATPVGQQYPTTTGQPYPPAGVQPYHPTGVQPYPPAGVQPYSPTGVQPYPPMTGQPYPPTGGQPYPPFGN